LMRGVEAASTGLGIGATIALCSHFSGDQYVPLRDEIVQQALSLSPADRAYVADALEHSLAEEGFSSTEVARAWVDEVDRRLAAYGRGETTATDANDAIQLMRRYLNPQREQ